MWPVSDLFLTTARTGTAKQVAYVDVVTGGNTVGDPIPFTSAEINVRLSDATRRSVTFTALDPDGTLWPTAAGARFSPWGTEIRVRIGFAYDDGTEELAPAGIYRLVSMDDDGLGSIPTEGEDRSVNVQPGAPYPYVIPSGITIDEAVRRVLTARYEAAELVAITSPWTVPPMVFPYGEDHWSLLLDLAESGGHDLAVNAAGQFQLRDTQEDATRILEYVEGVDNVVFDVVRELAADPRQVPNGIIVEGTNSRLTADVIGQAWDEDPTSPTRRDGPYGNHAQTESDDKVMTNLQAEAAARGLLREALGSQHRLTMSAPVNPAHDVGDVIRVRYPSRGIDGEYVIDELDFSTDPAEPMRVGCRRRVVTG
ncbi:MAG TPA: DUF5047 domain-containing protein [Acidimicrobiales bacterium]|jgi:hypothetical protein